MLIVNSNEKVHYRMSLFPRDKIYSFHIWNNLRVPAYNILYTKKELSQQVDEFTSTFK